LEIKYLEVSWSLSENLDVDGSGDGGSSGGDGGALVDVDGVCTACEDGSAVWSVVGVEGCRGGVDVDDLGVSISQVVALCRVGSEAGERDDTVGVEVVVGADLDSSCADVIPSVSRLSLFRFWGHSCAHDESKDCEENDVFDHV